MKIQMQLTKDKEFFKAYVNSEEEEELERLFYEFVSQMLAYKDDSQIVEVVSKKYYSDKPRVEVELEDII